jgi:hypothetical protein
MSRYDRHLFGLVLARWGFAALVAAAIAVGFFAGATVTPPVDLPTVALRAEPVYRVEVGGAVFISLYVATMALTLALHNRGFTEFGSGGVRAQGLAEDSDEALSGDYAMDLLADMRDEVDDLQRRIGRNQNV